MSSHQIKFLFLTGISKPVFTNARLKGSWDQNGRYSETWSETAMTAVQCEDGCPGFTVQINLDDSQANPQFKWGVLLDGPAGSNIWGIVEELNDVHSVDRYRTFQLRPGSLQTEKYYFNFGRRLGANKFYENGQGEPKLRFSVWAPNAQAVTVVFPDDPTSGYIYKDGRGIAATQMPLSNFDGFWESEPLDDFMRYRSQPYMYKIELKGTGEMLYRTDIFSRSQIGSGCLDPDHLQQGQIWDGRAGSLNGSKSCSVVIDPDVVRAEFERPRDVLASLIPAEEFWINEFDLNRPVPTSVSDLVIYELHIGSLGFGNPGPGTLQDAINLLDYLVELGINAVELLPMADFSGNVGWGYGSTHHLVIQTAAGGRDQYRHFIRECHRRGIAVIQDVVYNHYDTDAERAQWQYDSKVPEQNIYYWYEKTDHDGSYLYNGSSGATPNFREPVVRQQFISSAVFLIEEMHVDGLRVDLTQAIHRDNVLETDHRISVGEANLFGTKFLREWSRTLKIIRPSVMLIAEDHTGWDAVTKLPADGGLGFDATWYVYFYHALIGDSDSGRDYARLLRQAGFGYDDELSMEGFASQLRASQFNKVVYHESHDEAGNATDSARTMSVAVNRWPLTGETRIWAQARSRVVFGISVLSAGTPMFLMGEEVAAQKLYTYDKTDETKEDIFGEKTGSGAAMFRYYQDIIKLSRQFSCVRSKNIDILHVHNKNRLIVFKRYEADQQLLIIASLNNFTFNNYRIESDAYRLPDGFWREIFNSDASLYEGFNHGNPGASIPSQNGIINLAIPANGLLVLVKK